MLLGDLGGVAEAGRRSRMDAEGGTVAGPPVVLRPIDLGHQAPYRAVARGGPVDLIGAGCQLVQVRHVDGPDAKETEASEGIAGECERLERAGPREGFVEEHEAVWRRLV